MVCGKLTEEEENDTLLQVVEAFSVCEDNKDGIGVVDTQAIVVKTDRSIHNVSVANVAVIGNEKTDALREGIEAIPMPLPSLLSSRCNTAALVPSVEHIHEEMIIRPVYTSKFHVNIPTEESSDSIPKTFPIFDIWNDNEGSVYQISSEYISTLQSRGFAIVRLPQKSHQIVQSALILSSRFFDITPMEVKETFHMGSGVQLGYVNNIPYCKEFFQLRRCSNVESETPWSHLEEYQQWLASLSVCYHELHAICCSLTEYDDPILS